MRDYCEHDTFRADCRAGEVVIIQEAHYGRMGLGTCIKNDFGSLNCYRLDNSILFSFDIFVGLISMYMCSG